MRLPFLLFALLISVTVFSQQINIIPQPVSVKQPKIAAKFNINSATQIVVEGSNLEKTASYLNEYLKQFYKLQLKVAPNSKSKNVIRLNFERLDAPVEGAYILTVDNNGVYIAGDNEAGVFYGIQTLIQLLPIGSGGVQIPYLSVEDQPRFEYRGMHLDVGRHFFPVSFVKKYIDYLALHKMNYFHWHLTEDQGWRIEIKKYPELTSVGSWRNGTIIGRYPGTGSDNIQYGGHYTQEEIKEVVRYAKERYIDVIPEIEMPGHGSAAIAAYSWLSCFPEKPTPMPANMISKKSVEEQSKGRIKLVQETWGVFDDVFCAGKDSTFLFLQNVIDEVITLFPSKYFHIGGDECPKTHWKICPHCQKRMKDNNLKDEHELQSFFVQRIEKYLNSKGKTLIGWDEILEGGLAPKAIVMSWRGEQGGIAAARQNHNVIMTPGGWVYFDHSQTLNEDSVTIGGYTTVEKTYSYEPVPDSLTAEQGKYVMGAQGNVWTEYMGNEKKVEYMIFPRMAALSEVLWSKKEKRDSIGFQKRLMMQFKRYDLWKANYSKAYFDLNASIISSPNNTIMWKLNNKNSNGNIIYIKGKARNATFNYTSPILITNNGEYGAASTRKDHTFISNWLWQKFYINKATGKKITLTNPPSERFPGDGSFTLVNGVQNEKGRARSNEFVGFNGTDCEAIIDLGKAEKINNVKVHLFQQTVSWIWRPQYVEIFSSIDGKNFTSIGMTDDVNTRTGNGTMEKDFNNVSTRYLKVVIKNWGEIPAGNPGAGNKAWLLVDEIEVN